MSPRLTVEELRAGLLRHNYFPRSARRADELPPCLDTSDLTDELAAKVASLAVRSSQPRGYDAMPVMATRFNLVPRRLEIPHPHPYLVLAELIAENWSDLDWLSGNSISRLRPRVVGDGRVASMNALPRKRMKRRFDSRVVVKADISSFYDSVYSHSVPWAILGQAEAKRRWREDDLFANKLDVRLRQLRRNETMGISIGPATSLIIGDLILGAIDKELVKFEYDRFIDDYVAYCATSEEADDFLRRLRLALADFKLNINPRKTVVESLPQVQRGYWLRELTDLGSRADINDLRSLLALIDRGIELASDDPKASALKYAATVVERRTAFSGDDGLQFALLSRLIAVSVHNPSVVPAVSRMSARLGASVPRSLQKAIDRLIRIHARMQRSDCVAWLLYAREYCGFALSTKTRHTILDCADPLSLSLLAASGEPVLVDDAERFVTGKLALSPDPFENDRYWLLLYTLHANSSRAKRYVLDDAALSALTAAGVKFIKWPSEDWFDDDPMFLDGDWIDDY